MASCSSLLSEEQVLCSICLEVFNEPVSIPCGHNFCKVCISNYWDTADLCQCPLCKDTFNRRPELRVNTTFRDLVENVKRMKVRDEEKSPAGPGEVPCDVCTGTKLKALKSCLVCQTSYCETHLEPHLRRAALKKHRLIHPVENLEDRMCKKHDRLLEFFCRKDQICVCVICMKGAHKHHDTVCLEEECRQKKTKLGEMMAHIDQMTKTRCMKLQQMTLGLETLKRNTEREISDSVEVFTALVSSIQRSQAELIQNLEEKQKRTEKHVDYFIQGLEQGITELKKRSSELEKLSHSEDDLHLLQTFPSLKTPPHTRDYSGIFILPNERLGEETARVVSQLMETLKTEMEKKVPEARLKMIQQRYAVNVTLNPKTASPDLILSGNGKQVRHGEAQKNLPDDTESTDAWPVVLGKPSFSTGRFYYEVEVEEKTAWILGVVREKDQRPKIKLSPKNGYWTILLRNGDKYKAAAGPDVLLSLREKPQKVGVFVDYVEGRVSFYNVEARSHIYSFTGCTFTGKLYPYFNPCLNDGGKNSAPLIITAVNRIRRKW